MLKLLLQVIACKEIECPIASPSQVNYLQRLCKGIVNDTWPDIQNDCYEYGYAVAICNHLTILPPSS